MPARVRLLHVTSRKLMMLLSRLAIRILRCSALFLRFYIVFQPFEG